MIALIYPERTSPIYTIIEDFSDLHSILGGCQEMVEHSPEGEITFIREDQEDLEKNVNFPLFKGVVVKIREPLLLTDIPTIH